MKTVGAGRRAGNDRWRGSKNVLVIGDADAAALRAGTPLSEWIDARCAGCDAPLTLPTRDLNQYLSAVGGKWPSRLECPDCNRRREQAEADATRAVCEHVVRVRMICMRTADRGDRLQISLLASVPQFLHLTRARELLAAAARIAGDWALPVDTLLSAAACAVAKGFSDAELLSVGAQERGED
jgi:hypothetical protein